MDARVRKHFAPGNVIYSNYWREHDVVLDLVPTVNCSGTSWYVLVVSCDENGVPVPGEPVRKHCTYPDTRDRVVKTGVVVKGVVSGT